MSQYNNRNDRDKSYKKESHIYHEKQDALLCGQHCLNNLLQNPIFSPIDLSEIAQNLDIQERQITMDNLNGLGEYSSNVDESGNFSIQVLKTALEQSNQIELISWSGSTVRQNDPIEEKGFIVNRDSHWFTIRKINDVWWNLNSTFDIPEEITPFYLTAFLFQLRNDGYTILIAKSNNELPSGQSSLLGSGGASGTWYRESDLLNKRAGVDGAVVEGSFIAFQGDGNKLGGSSTSSSNVSNSYEDDMALAIQLSMSQSPIETEEDKKRKIRELRLAALEKRGM
jgi:ataxin-3